MAGKSGHNLNRDPVITSSRGLVGEQALLQLRYHNRTPIKEDSAHMHKGFMTALAASAAALALGLSTTAAMAGTNTGWTVSPGGAATASGAAQVKDTVTTTVAKCTTLSTKLTLKKTATGGAKLGSITSATFTGCTIGPIAVSVTSNATAAKPWYLNATSYNATTGVTSGNISGIILTATATGCSALLEGATVGATGTVKASYTNSTHKLALLAAGGTLHDQSVSGCLGLINDGDAEDASGGLTATPAQTITGP
jgi:hypothetical protein